MPPLVVPNAALLRLIWAMGGTQYAVNVIGCRKTGAGLIDQGIANTVSTGVMTAYTASGLAALQPTTVQLNSVGLRDISQPSQPEFIGTAAPTSGTAAGGKLLPPQTALVVTIRTALAGRSYRGRVYVPGWHDSTLTATGTANAAAVTAAKAFVDQLGNALSPSGLSVAVVSRTLSQVNAATATQVRDSVWDTIRGRAIPGI